MFKADISFSKEDIEKLAEAANQRVRSIIIDRLSEIGAESVKIARELPDDGGTYHNRTHRLRNSIGYMVTENGQPVAADFLNADGRQAAMQHVNDHDGYDLIIVAGAEYAMDVHVRGYDVLDSAIINAERQFKEFCDNIQQGN